MQLNYTTNAVECESQQKNNSCQEKNFSSKIVHVNFSKKKKLSESDIYNRCYDKWVNIRRADDNTKTIVHEAVWFIAAFEFLFLQNPDEIIFNSELLKTKTIAKEKQRSRYLAQLADLYNIKFHTKYNYKGKIYWYVYTATRTENCENILENPELFYKNQFSESPDIPTKMTAQPVKNDGNIYSIIEENKNIYNTDILDNIDVEIEKNSEFESPKKSEFLKENFVEEVEEKVTLISIKEFTSKTLKDFYPLTRDQVYMLNSRSHREFNLNFANQLLLKLSVKYPTRTYDHHNQFFSYMTKAFVNEKHQAAKVNHETFRFTANVTSEEQEYKAMEKRLYEIEDSRDTSKKSQLQKKIAGIYDPKEAIEVLDNYDFIYDKEKHTMRIGIKNGFSQTEHAKEMLRNEIRAVYGADVKIGILPSVKEIANDVKITPLPQISYTKPLEPLVWDESRSNILNLWGKVRAELRKYIGENHEKSFFSNVKITELEDGKIKLIPESPAMLRHIREFHSLNLYKSFKAHGYEPAIDANYNKEGIIFESTKTEK